MRRNTYRCLPQTADGASIASELGVDVAHTLILTGASVSELKYNLAGHTIDVFQSK